MKLQIAILGLGIAALTMIISQAIYPDKNQIHLRTPSSNDSLVIQYMELSVNPFLFKEIRKYIREQSDSCQLFKNGFGYITISDIKTVRNGQPVLATSLNEHLQDVEVEFNLGLSSFYPHQGIGIPLYYSFIDQKLILIYDQNLAWINRSHYSMSSQQKIKKLIKQTLSMEFSEGFEFKGLEGNTFKLTAEQRKTKNIEQVLELGSFTLGKLKTVIQHFDGSVSYR